LTDLIGKMIRRFRKARAEEGVDISEVMEMANFDKMNEIRSRVDDLVDDPEVAEKLKPYYRMFCKRPTFNDEYLPTFNRPNVELVDTDGRGVERITEGGVVVAGVEYEVDCIVFATGFEVVVPHMPDGPGMRSSAAGDRPSPRSGLKGCHPPWHAEPGLSDCFFLHISQAAFTANFPHLLDELTTHVSHIGGHALSRGISTVEVAQDAEDAWVETIKAKGLLAMGALGGPDCTPGYYNNEGKAREPGAIQSARMAVVRSSSSGSSSVAWRRRCLRGWSSPAESGKSTRRPLPGARARRHCQFMCDRPENTWPPSGPCR
jgi:cyclohexanone monooxygenase